MCDKIIPCCQPCDTGCCGPYNEQPMYYSGADLDSMPQCPPRCPPPRSKYITLQQPPRLICKKRVQYVNKIINEPRVLNRCKRIQIPKVVETTKMIRVPKLTWVTQLIKEPRIIYCSAIVPDPCVVCCPRTICEPREVCQMLLCQPKPQYIDVPPPTEYCCYPTGPTNCQPNVMCPMNNIVQNNSYNPMQNQTYNYPQNTLTRPAQSGIYQSNGPTQSGIYQSSGSYDSSSGSGSGSGSGLYQGNSSYS